LLAQTPSSLLPRGSGCSRRHHPPCIQRDPFAHADIVIARPLQSTEGKLEPKRHVAPRKSHPLFSPSTPAFAQPDALHGTRESAKCVPSHTQRSAVSPKRHGTQTSIFLSSPLPPWLAPLSSHLQPVVSFARRPIVASQLSAPSYPTSVQSARHPLASHRLVSPRIASHRLASHRLASHRLASPRIASHRLSGILTASRFAACGRYMPKTRFRGVG
jgi:hypothetical protein